MELRRLRLLHEFARRGTVAAVAEALSYSPSSVSVQLAELEREAGDAAAAAQPGARSSSRPPARGWPSTPRSALTADEAVRAELAALSGTPRGRVRMTFVQTPALALLSTALRELAETAPDLRVEVTHSETAPAIADLRSRAVDLVVGIDYDPVPVPRHRDVDRARPDPRGRPAVRPHRPPAGGRARPDLARRVRARRLGGRLPGQRPPHRARAPLQPPRRLRARHRPPHRRRADHARARRLRPGRDDPRRADRHRHPAGRRAPDRRGRRAPHDLHRRPRRRPSTRPRSRRSGRRCATPPSRATAGREDVKLLAE